MPFQALSFWLLRKEELLLIFLVLPFLPLFDPPQALQSSSHTPSFPPCPISRHLLTFIYHRPFALNFSLYVSPNQKDPASFLHGDSRLFTGKPQCCPMEINDNPIQSFMFSWNKENRLVCSVFNLICLNYHHSICNQLKVINKISPFF